MVRFPYYDVPWAGYDVIFFRDSGLDERMLYVIGSWRFSQAGIAEVSVLWGDYKSPTTASELQIRKSGVFILHSWCPAEHQEQLFSAYNN